MALAVLDRGPVVASDYEQPALAEIDQLLDHRGSDAIKLVGPGGEEVALPTSTVRVLRQVVHALAHDQAVAIVPFHKQLTTQQAADLINVSRPYLVRLLDEGKIPHTKTGKHRRVRFDDLMAYKARRDAERREGLAKLTQLNQELGLYSSSRE